MQSQGPLLTDKSRVSLIQLITPALVVYLFALGLMRGDPLGIILGALLALYFAFTFHRRYELYRDALVIRYLAPRTMVVSLSDITEARIVRVPLRGETLLIHRESGGPLLIRPDNTPGFLARLDEIRQ